MSSVVDQLNEAISRQLAGTKAETPPHEEGPGHGTETGLAENRELQQLLDVASELRYLPCPEFRAVLGKELERAGARRALRLAGSGGGGRALPAARVSEMPMQSLFGIAGGLPVSRSHLAMSFAVHVAGLALVLSSGMWVAQHHEQVQQQVIGLLGESSYVLPPAATEAHGGGGGGDQDKLPASRGTPPRFAQDQLTPPVVVVRNEAPKLTAEATVVGPPEIVFPQTGQVGDPLGALFSPPSSGTGSGGGIGSGSGGGVGSGIGPGVGEGRGGGIGGGMYRVGGGVTAPRPIYDPDPEYSDEARKAKFQGSVTLWVVVTPDGRTRDIQVKRSLGMGLDEKAIEAVKTWRFEPGRRNGQPVAVMVSVEVTFRLY